MFKFITSVCLLSLLFASCLAQDTTDNHSRRLNKSSEIRQYLKSDIEPCDDFYKYTCGNFKDNSQMFGSLISGNYVKKVHDYLKTNEVNANDSNLEKKVKNFYKSCVQREDNWEMKRQFFLNIMEEYGGMPLLKGEEWQEDAFDWLQVLSKIMGTYNQAIIVSVIVEPDFTNTQIQRIHIGEIQDMLKRWDDMLRPWQFVLMKLFDVPENDALKASEEMIAFAKNLSQGINDELDYKGWHTLNKLTLLETMDEKYGPTMNFTSLITTWLGQNYRLPVYVYKEKYLENLKSVIEQTPPRIVANYILWSLITQFNFDYQNDVKQRERSCAIDTRKIFYKFIDNKMYEYVAETQPKNIEQARVLFENLRKSFEQQLLKSSSWMSDVTRNKALEKLQAIKFYINGYLSTNFTTLMEPLQITENDYLENSVNILKQQSLDYRLKLNQPPGIEHFDKALDAPVYLSDHNAIILPMMFVLSPDLWHEAYPKALLYATMGSLIGHELTHPFDDDGRHFNAQGNLQIWWDSKADKEFVTRVECLREQYKNYTNGDDSPAQGENIADVNGLKVAYHAYNQWLSEHPEARENLPHLEAFSSHQLFFIAASQTWCTTLADKRLFSNIHSAAQVKVQGMMSNLQAFAEAFQCENGSPMNPVKKCVFY